MHTRRFSPMVWLGILGVLVLATVVSPIARAASYSHLNPGGPADLPEKVPITFVFVGYESTDVNQDAFLDALPKQYKPVVRSRLYYGVEEFLGLNYTYDYKVVFADSAYENRLFDYLQSKGTPAPLTTFQQAYNEQDGALDIANTTYIDAPSVEKWLARNAPAGVNTRRNTVFFINWWGNKSTPREGFQHHVYTKIGEPDPDTGYDFGKNRASRKIIAWGGTTADDEETGLGSTRRVWFHDLSAGPESRSGNYDVTNADLDGDGVPDYRIPPVWEYFSPGGYRAASALTGDLAKVSRYVAINLLMTTSPSFPPGYTPERLPRTINLDYNTYDNAPGLYALDYLKPKYVEDEVEELHREAYNYDSRERNFTGKAYECFVKWPIEPCYPDRPYPADANLFVYNALTIDKTRDGNADYEAPIINYAIPDELATYVPLGFADDNYLDGTQSFVFNFLSPGIVESGYGLTTTSIHEYGHHLALSHPHDGYDYEQALDYNPEGDLYFAWTGDETNSMMSYIDLNWDFSQFDRDNFNRFYAAAYVANANTIAGDVIADPDAAKAEADLKIADSSIGKAKSALAAHNYIAAYDFARSAYSATRRAANRAGVTVNASQKGVFVQQPLRGQRPSRDHFESTIDKNVTLKDRTR